LTGKESYTLCSDALQADVMNNPDLLLGQQYATLSAGWFWRKHGLNDLAESKQYETMTKRINGGLTGQDDRLKRIDDALKVLTQ
jgi:putative chitinase